MTLEPTRAEAAEASLSDLARREELQAPPASSRFTVLSIQPKQSASSTASS